MGSWMVCCLDFKKGFLSCASEGIDGAVFLITIKQTTSINRGCRFPMQTMLHWEKPRGTKPGIIVYCACHCLRFDRNIEHPNQPL